MFIPDNLTFSEVLRTKVSPSIILVTRKGPSRLRFGFCGSGIFSCMGCWIADDISWVADEVGDFVHDDNNNNNANIRIVDFFITSW